MKAAEAILMERANNARKDESREKTWRDIEKIKDELLRKELKKTYPKPVNNGRRKG